MFPEGERGCTNPQHSLPAHGERLVPTKVDNTDLGGQTVWLGRRWPNGLLFWGGAS